jgi:hypothetical protein
MADENSGKELSLELLREMVKQLRKRGRRKKNTMRKQTNYSLKQTYCYFNRGWFGGRLPSIPIRFGWPEDRGSGEYDPDGVFIIISYSLRKWPRYTAIVVLHEMVHAKQHLLDGVRPEDLRHARLFKRDIRWLVNHGAYDKLL